MGGNMSRNKGARGEREVIAMLQPIVDKVCAEHGVESVLLQRNLMQAHIGGCDLHGLEWLSLEVKRQEAPAVETWWKQTVRQAKPHQVPVLIWRQNNKGWSVMLTVRLEVGRKHLRCRVQISLAVFLVYFEQRIREELAASAGSA